MILVISCTKKVDGSKTHRMYFIFFKLNCVIILLLFIWLSGMSYRMDFLAIPKRTTATKWDLLWQRQGVWLHVSAQAPSIFFFKSVCAHIENSWTRKCQVASTLSTPNFDSLHRPIPNPRKGGIFPPLKWPERMIPQLITELSVLTGRKKIEQNKTKTNKQKQKAKENKQIKRNTL